MFCCFQNYYVHMQANICKQKSNMFASWNKLTLSLSIPVRQEVVWYVYLARPHDQYMLPAVLFKADISSDVIAVEFTIFPGDTVYCHVHSEIGFRGQYKSCLDLRGNVQRSAMALVTLAFTVLDNMGTYHEDLNNCLVSKNVQLCTCMSDWKENTRAVYKMKALPLIPTLKNGGFSAPVPKWG